MATAQTSALPNGCCASVAHRPGGAGLLAVVTERELHCQPRQEQVHDAVGHQAGPDEMVEGVALLGLPARLLRVGHEAPCPKSSSLNQDSRT